MDIVACSTTEISPPPPPILENIVQRASCTCIHRIIYPLCPVVCELVGIAEIGRRLVRRGVVRSILFDGVHDGRRVQDTTTVTSALARSVRGPKQFWTIRKKKREDNNHHRHHVERS